ncbi:hypothetical protein M501DRAFT_1000779 [Patellaria atrata CBS 101060]|uniref:Uncharacterized protein n=1 Tax=Patellaria atrata CBS 101060 TaxID=1346257 RepID=A0A9P4SEU5_9PEZI|nr:hypothetical protein M501DRAFT_1000779 [Patellaria atrata CBS 101060]
MSGYDLRMIRDAIEKQRARRRFHLKTPKPSSPPKSHATYSKISGYDTSYSTALRIPHSALPVRTEVTVTSTRRRHPAIPYPFPKSGDTNISLLSSIPQSPASMSILDTPSYIAQLNRFNNREEEIDAEAHTPLRTPSTPSVLSFVQSPRPSISQVSPFTPIRDGHDVTPTGSMRGGDGNGYGRRTSIGNGIHGNFKMGVRGMNRLVRFMVGSEVEEEDGGLPVREDT